MNRRSLLQTAVAVAGFGVAGCQGSTTECADEVACFSFVLGSADDVASRLTIEHTGGEEQLKAGDVFVTNVSVDYEDGEMETLAWAELDGDLEPDETINGESIQIKLGMTDFVRIIWDNGDYRQTIEAWVADDDAR